MGEHDLKSPGMKMLDEEPMPGVVELQLHRTLTDFLVKLEIATVFVVLVEKTSKR